MMKRNLMVFLLVVTMVIMAGCSAEKEQSVQETVPTEMPTYEVYGTEPPTETPVQVEMPEYQFTYSGELKDSIVMKDLEEVDGLEFTVKLSSGEVHIFTLYYNTVEGDFVTVLDDGAGNKIPVAFQMATIPEGLSQEDTNIFYWAQESVNEIANSLVLK